MENENQKFIFSQRLKYLMDKEKLNGREFSERSGIPHNNLKKYVTQACTPKYDVLIQIADFFNVTVDYLLGRTDSPDAPKIKTQYTVSYPKSEYEIQKNDVGDISNIEDLTDLEIVAIKKMRRISLDDKLDAINYIMKKKDTENP